MTKEEFETLQKLSAREDLVIQKSDKGNSVVILNKADYLLKMQELISDPDKFVKVNVEVGKDYNFMERGKNCK